MRSVTRSALVWVALGVLGALTLGATPATAAARTCGEIARQGEMAIELVTVRATGVRCRRARTVLARHTRGQATAGWTCNSAGTEARCTRGSAVASYRAASRVRACGNVGFVPQTDSGAFGIVAKRTGCRTARAVARTSKLHEPMRDGPNRYTARGFTCRGFYRDYALVTVLYTCRRGARIVAFSRS